MMAYLSSHAHSGFGIGAFFARLGATLRAMHVNLQVARMESVLAHLSEDQLKRIGITYAEIPAHARKLVVGD